MAVADLVLNGFEMALTRATLVGNAAVSTTNPRTGTYSFRTNPSASTSTGAFKGFAATGLTGTNLGRTAETFYTVYLRITTLPGSNTIGIMGVQASAGTSVVRVDMTTGGALTLVGTSTSSTVATLSTGTWYRLDLRVTSNGTSGLKVDGGSETTITANNVTQDQLVLGVMTSETADLHWDDLVIGTTSPGGAVEIKRIGPTAIGSQTSGWTGGTGSGAYTEVDEVSQDGDTTYWGASGSTTARRTVALQDCATVGITGTVHAVAGVAAVRDEGGSSGMGVTMRNGTTNSDKTSLDPGASYIALVHLRTTDPNGGGSWTTGGVDSLEVGVYANDITAVRCTMLAVEVAYTPTAGTTATPGVLAMTTATFAPTVTVSDNKTATPGVLALLTSLFAPVVALPQLVTPDKLSLTTATFAPTVTVSDNQVATPGVLAQSLSAFAPVVSVSGNQTVTPDVLALVTQTYAPAVGQPQVVTPDTLAMVSTGFAPTITASLNQLVSPSTLALTIVLFAPDVTGDVVVFGPFPLAGSVRVGGVTIGGAVTGGIRLRGTAQREDR